MHWNNVRPGILVFMQVGAIRVSEEDRKEAFTESSSLSAQFTGEGHLDEEVCVITK